MNENLSTETLAGANQLAAADGGVTVESPSLSLADLNKHLGSDFKDPATALKSLKDTKDFVGKRKADIVAEVQGNLPSTNTADLASKSDVQALQDQLFISQNPQYKEYLPLLKNLGPTLAEAVSNAEFKTLFEKAKVADEVANTRSVVTSNSRLSQSKSVVDQAVNTANARGSTQEDVAMVLARGIMGSE